MTKTQVVPIRFFVITFAWAWIPWLACALCGLETLEKIRTPAIAFGAFGPAVGALCSVRATGGKGAVRTYLKSFMTLAFGWKTWIAIFCALGSSTAVAWILPRLFGEAGVSTLLPSVYLFPLYWLLMVFLGGGQEEIGWRGYLLPLLEQRFGRWPGSGILGLIWASWHVPLWFIPGTSQASWNFGGFVILLLGYSFFFSWVREASGRRPLAGMIAHGTANAFVPVFPVIVVGANASPVRFWIWVSLTLAVGIVFLKAQTARNSSKEDSP